MLWGHPAVQGSVSASTTCTKLRTAPFIHCRPSLGHGRLIGNTSSLVTLTDSYQQQKVYHLRCLGSEQQAVEPPATDFDAHPTDDSTPIDPLMEARFKQFMAELSQKIATKFPTQDANDTSRLRWLNARFDTWHQDTGGSKTHFHRLLKDNRYCLCELKPFPTPEALQEHLQANQDHIVSLEAAKELDYVSDSLTFLTGKPDRPNRPGSRYRRATHIIAEA